MEVFEEVMELPPNAATFNAVLKYLQKVTLKKHMKKSFLKGKSEYYQW